MKYPNTPTTHNLQPTTLITGGTGFVGSHLVEELLHRGEKNIVVTNYSPEAGCVGQLLPKENIVQLDLTNRDETFELIQKLQPKKIFHLASIAVVGKSFDKASHIFQNNITLQLNLLEAVRQHSPDSRMLIIGSGAEYGKIEPSETITEETLLNPIDPYAVSKVTQDLLALSYFNSYHLNVIRARPFNHIGERQTTDFAIPAFISQIVEIEQGKREKLMVGNLEAIRDFTDVKDVVKAYVLMMEKGEPGAVYNVASGNRYSMKEILDMMVQLTKTPVTIEQDQNRLRPSDIPIMKVNSEKLKSLGWSAEIDIHETLERIFTEWREKRKNTKDKI